MPIGGTSELDPQRFGPIPDMFLNGLDVIPPFIDAHGDRLSSSRRALVERVARSYPQMLRHRIESSSVQTLIHGDAHFWNFLYPKDETQPALLIDWQDAAVHFGAYDLAYMIALHWFPDRREQFETLLLRTYHSELQRHEIDYGYDELLYDYRLQVAAMLLLPMIHWAAKLPAYVWWPHMDRAFSAFNDLDCGELLP
jgi:Ser/Thr protein kinase RdoA (MazF antagonist)